MNRTDKERFWLILYFTISIGVYSFILGIRNKETLYGPTPDIAWKLKILLIISAVFYGLFMYKWTKEDFKETKKYDE